MAITVLDAGITAVKKNRPKFPPHDTNILTDRLTEQEKCRTVVR